MQQAEVHKVFLVEDHASFRQSLAMMLDTESDLQVVGQAGSLAEARNSLKSLRAEDGPFPDLGLFDLNLPDGSGTELVSEFRETNPDFAALALTASVDSVDHARAIEHGAAGVLHKMAEIEEVVEALRKVATGKPLLSREEIARMVNLAANHREEKTKALEGASRLTRRELQVLNALAEGKSNKEIAEELSISLDTERTHMVNILNKLGAHSRLQALVTAVKSGVVSIGG
ncbi:Response regulator containing a CheY-like receiver domain and an HTH DNA-binding domain [Rubrobacter radiotolerans]|uniref:Response regulator containing a CheY-like receiver domain and an HTH DNA-binding domain n=1 Tax=Rubrobacter radiotolerans TaxID=42256 RepID=A0A023X7C8_RUBRA|nr:response regulator transcription factor [Rubrobacter radiotolerans]AHY47945.1 Response regulator containing a CheY-like receiver domain and an HTH DNA-binding domain [Rubrobacter radiotolerans]MDX5892583.1 response regulator transcription factor [Rubrobacter radiotolerans]SMC07874.1 two component transcriptional regulator, LuxR family [Rubrobacter radiotolerans DSM 5868]